MSDFKAIENDFLDSLTDIIKENISSEKFGVSELAHEIGMSRSNLLRKVKTLTRISVSQFIRQVRLKQAMEMLRQTSFTVSEVSYKVGFGSTSYFIKCFHDYYGYPPGEVGNRVENIDDYVQSGLSGKKKFIVFLGLTLGIIIILAVLYIIFKPVSLRNRALDKSIAVLPFRNESNDSSNVYIINGLMESILTDLQQINDLRVVSRTSVEKYRNTNKQIPEIAKELNVNYFIEGSGQKIGNQILLNIQLIEGPDDKHLWARQYRRRTDDIFDLQIELAGDIAKGVKAIITPEEEARIKKPPTGNLVAYDYFLKGLDLFDKGTRQDLEKAIPFFEKAIEHDNNFARAYADLAITYYFLDAFQTEKKYSVEIGNYADKALSIDDQLAQSLIAKALFFINTGQNKKAVPYLEKALEYNPNSALVINILSDFYARYSPDTGKYLEYALKGIRLDIAANDSNTVSFIYLHVSNAFIQSGFINEAEFYINKSLEYNPDNFYSEYIKAYILYSKNRDLARIRRLLVNILNQDSTRLDVLQETAKICYFMRDYESAYKYYKRFIMISNAQGLDIYRAEDGKIGVVFSKMGQEENSEEYFRRFKEYSENDKSIYKNLNLALYYSYKGDIKNALDQMKLFSQEENYFYWTLIFLKLDPLMDNIKDLPEFKKIFSEIENKFWQNHNSITASLKKKKLL
jgi:TolB-like protein/AraC-like DNA-binding protein/Tfp pilus assembly protein PilF